MNKIVIGAGFGDCGKGLVTDWLCSKASKPACVARFSGGHQCGHTVIVDGKRHVFSNFGSGTLRGIPTVWMKFCTVEPVGFMRELKVLKDMGVDPEIHIDANCPITTPFDIVSNQSAEEESIHGGDGSCGVGCGATWEREEAFYSLLFYDMFFLDIFKAKLDAIEHRYYCIRRSGELDNRISEFLKCCSDMIQLPNIQKDLPTRVQDYIFEGAQGLLLDQHYGVFPNVTRSNTGLKNLWDTGWISRVDEVFLVTRSFQTRHGKGFMTNESISNNITIDPLETNVENKYQGKFRRSLLDVSLLEYGINRDPYIRNLSNTVLVITHMDSIKSEYRYTYKGDIVGCSNEDAFVAGISDILGIKTVYLSHSPESKNITKWIK